MEKILTSTHQVRFQDCDPFKHLNNSKYLDYFINAREDHVKKHYGLDLFEFMKKKGTGILSTSANARGDLHREQPN